MSQTLIAIIQPAGQSDEAYRRQLNMAAEYRQRMEQRAKSQTMDAQPIVAAADKPTPSLGVSLVIYALHTVCLLAALLGAGGLCLVFLGQLLGRVPLWH